MTNLFRKTFFLISMRIYLRHIKLLIYVHRFGYWHWKLRLFHVNVLMFI